MDRILQALLALPDPVVALELSLERILESRLLEAEKDRVVEGALEAGSALLEAARRSARRRASKHNLTSWPLSTDLTIKVSQAVPRKKPLGCLSFFIVQLTNLDLEATEIMFLLVLWFSVDLHTFFNSVYCA